MVLWVGWSGCKAIASADLWAVMLGLEATFQYDGCLNLYSK